MRKNKTQMFVMILLMLIIIALAAYTGTLEGDGGDMQLVSFPTATPTTDLIGSGWWNSMPTPITVEKLKP